MKQYEKCAILEVKKNIDVSFFMVNFASGKRQEDIS